MDVLAEIVKNLLVIIIMASFLELMLPDGNIKPFVRFSIGLFILITILNPVLAFIYNDRNLQINLWDYRIDKNQEKEIVENGKNINRQILNHNQDVLKEKIEGQIGAVAMLVPGVQDVQIKAKVNQDGVVEKLNLTVRPEYEQNQGDTNQVDVFSNSPKSFPVEEQEKIGEKIISVISNLYGLDDVDIDISFEGG